MQFLRSPDPDHCRVVERDDRYTVGAPTTGTFGRVHGPSQFGLNSGSQAIAVPSSRWEQSSVLLRSSVDSTTLWQWWLTKLKVLAASSAMSRKVVVDARSGSLG